MWRRDFDRLDRACQRVLQVLQHEQLQAEELVERLTGCRELAWRCCVEAVRRHPGADRDVPTDDTLAAVHHDLSRAATSVAQAAQALVMVEGDLSAADRAVATATARIGAAAAGLGLS